MNQTRQRAFTLIETIAVIGAIACVAAALFVPLIRRLDELARQKESTALANIAAAYKQRVTATRTIPSETGWAAAVASVNGWQLNVITNNDRGLRRIFLIDPNLRIGTNSPSSATYSLPYSQSVTGHTFFSNGVVVRPVYPRMMLVSSAGAALPATLVSGVGAASGPNRFNNIWDTADGAIPGGWTWTGRAEDLKIHRIDLSDLFVRVTLNNRDTAVASPSYWITTNINTFSSSTVTKGCRVPMYFLKGSEIKLYNVAGTNEHSEILSQSQSFTFEKGTWQSEAYLASSVGQPSAIDLQKAMNLFMAAPSNTVANTTQITVSNAMVNFLSNYVVWRNNDYALTNGNKTPNYVKDAQTALANATTAMIDVN